MNCYKQATFDVLSDGLVIEEETIKMLVLWTCEDKNTQFNVRKVGTQNVTVRYTAVIRNLNETI
jgi:hypothetical protein